MPTTDRVSLPHMNLGREGAKKASIVSVVSQNGTTFNQLHQPNSQTKANLLPSSLRPILQCCGFQCIRNSDSYTRRRSSGVSYSATREVAVSSDITRSNGDRRLPTVCYSNGLKDSDDHK
ncbi:hypothetical protein Ciccas_005937 [Cichlidogyrus casuarinus]|uniref:Uncharacterized protein n=1 Tax=Cichlidogyrus casuarinus TaxID=1844966 RepID=A0ABD2Q7Q8_9PLAT